MKFIVFLLISFPLLSQVVSRRDFDEFMKKLPKSYKEKYSADQRRQIYQQRSEKIQKYNRQKNTTFKMEPNHLSVLTDSERKRLNGFQYSPVASTLSTRSQTVTVRNLEEEIPDSIDWRDCNVVSPVKDQGFLCGSCWAFATTGHLESLIAINMESPVVELSVQQLIDCNVNPKIGNYGCKGGFMTTSLGYARIQDITVEDDYTYQGIDGICSYNVPQNSFNFSKPFITKSGNEDDLKRAVALYGPITAAIDANHDTFFEYSTGVYYDPECTQWLNHAVLVVGYGTDPDGGDYWIVKNSWSEYWGENGYVRLARNRNNHCGIASYGVYVNMI